MTSSEGHGGVSGYDTVLGESGPGFRVTEACGSASIVDIGDVNWSPVGDSDDETKGVTAAGAGVTYPLDGC